MRAAPRAASGWRSNGPQTPTAAKRSRNGDAGDCVTPESRSMPGRSVARLVNKADFERLLGARWRARSAHFALHHVSAAPTVVQRLPKDRSAADLSTAATPMVNRLVDNSPDRVWFGCVVPKRHARRAVTRNLLKRQMRGAFQRHGDSLATGLWLVRLRSSFAVAEFISARSAALATAARGELDALLAQATA